MALLTGSYATGTASVANDSTTVTITGTTSSFVPGDIFQAGTGVSMISSVTDTTHFELVLPWAASTVTGGAYQVTYLSTQRYQSAFNGQKVRQLLTLLDGIGVIYYVPSTASVPDPANGNDGDVALKITTGQAFQWWVKQSGAWVSQGSAIGLTWQGLWNSAHTYGANDITSRLGVLYIALLAGTNNPPEVSPTYWQVLLQGGNRYDLAFDASDRPDSGDTFRRFVFTTTVQFVAGMTDSRAYALIGATSTAVISLLKNNTQFATITFAAVGATVTASIASPCVITDTAHGLAAGQAVSFTTTGMLPTGLSPGVVYYVLAAGLTTNSYELGLTPGASAIVTSGSQSGTHTRFSSSTGTFSCPTTTTFNPGDIIDMIAPNPRDATLATLAITVTGYR
jgi:hypothetical protein